MKFKKPIAIWIIAAGIFLALNSFSFSVELPASDSYSMQVAGLGEGGTGADLGTDGLYHQRRHSGDLKVIDSLGQSLTQGGGGGLPYSRAGSRRLYSGGLFSALSLESSSIPHSLECEGEVDPVGLANLLPAFSAVFHHFTPGAFADRYRILVARDADFAEVIWDSGAAGTAMPVIARGERCAAVVYDGPRLFRDGSKYWWRIRFWEQSGSQTAWSETGLFQMSAENPGLPFRRPIEVTNPGSALSNHQVRVVINTAALIADGRIRADGADIRFTTADGLTPLDYWIESGVGTDETVIWVNLPEIPGGDSSILIHYGNPVAAPASDGESTFLFFDDFENGLEKWINVSGSAWVISDGVLQITTPPVNNNYLVANQSLGAAGIVIEVRMKSRHTSGSGHPGLIWHANTEFGNSQRNDQIYFRPHSYNAADNNQPAYFNGSLVTFGTATGLYNYNTWHNIRVDLVAANSVRVYRDGGNEANFANQQFPGNTYAGISTHAGNTQQWDDFRVRKYTDLQPTTRVGVEMMEWTGEENWSQRRLLLIDGGLVEEDLFSFPVLVHLGPNDDWNGFKPGGADIRFVDFAGEWELPYEIENWEEGVEAVIWVGLPLLVAGEDTRFWMYSDNPAAVSVERRESLWDADYRLVLHAAESGGDEVFRAASCGYENIPRDNYVYIKGQLRHSTGRSWAVTRLDRDWNWVESRQFDCYGSLGEATAMTNYIAALSAGTNVIVTTNDEPMNNVYNNAALIAQMRTLGATGSVISGLVSRASYLLVGQKGMAEGGAFIEKSGPRVGSGVYGFGTEIAESARGKIGVNLGAVASGAGKAGSALNFDGTLKCVEFNDQPGVTGNQTISFWLRPTDLSIRRNPYNKAYGGEATITQETNGKLSYYWGTHGGDNFPYQELGMTDYLSAGQWAYLTLVRDLSAGSPKLRWYKNGVQVAETGASYAAAAATIASLQIGKGYTNPYRGLIDEVRLSAFPRSAAWIKAKYLGFSGELFTWYPTELQTDGAVGPEGVINLIPEFSAVFNGPFIGGRANKHRLQVARDEVFTDLVWESGIGGAALPQTADGERCGAIVYAGDQIDTDGTTYYWRIKFWEAVAGEGEWSKPATFRMLDSVPTAPDGLQLDGEVEPMGVLNLVPVFTAIFHDPEFGDIAYYYQIQVARDAEFSDPAWDSGEEWMEMAGLREGERCPEIIYAGERLYTDGTGYFWRIRFRDQTEHEGAWSALAYFMMLNSIPVAPADLSCAGESNPSELAELAPVFCAIFNDREAGDSAVYYQVQAAIDSGFADMTWETGQAEMAALADGETFCLDYAGDPLIFDGGSYYWRIRFWDLDGNTGDWSEGGTFTMVDYDQAPAPPTDLLCRGEVAPIFRDYESPDFSAIYNDLDSADQAVKYRVQVSQDSGFNTVFWDSGVAGTAMSNVISGDRCGDILCGAQIPAGAKYYWRIKFWDLEGYEGEWSAAASFTIVEGGSTSGNYAAAALGLNTGGCGNDAGEKRGDGNYLLVDSLGPGVVSSGSGGVPYLEDGSARAYFEVLFSALDTTEPAVPGVPSAGESPTYLLRPEWSWTAASDNAGGSGLRLNDAYRVYWSQAQGGEDYSAWVEGNAYLHQEDLGFGRWYLKVQAVDREGNFSGASGNGSVLIVTPSPTPSATPTVTATPTPSVTPTATVTPSVVPTATPDGGCKIDLTVYLHGYLNEMKLVQRPATVNVEFRTTQSEAGVHAFDLDLDAGGRTGEEELWFLPPDSYYLLLRQKLPGGTFEGEEIPPGANHLAAVSSESRGFVEGVVTEVNFADEEDLAYLGVYVSSHPQASSPLLAVATEGRYWMLGGGDADGNRLINVADILKWDTLVGFPDADDRGEARFSEQGNFDGNDKIDGYDFNVWKRMVNEGITYAPLP